MQRDKNLLKEPAIQKSRATELTRNEPKMELLRELVAHLRQNRTLLREEWVARIAEAQLLTAMTQEEIFAEATSVYDSYVAALETGTFEALQAYARNPRSASFRAASKPTRCGHRAAVARRAGALTVRQVPDRL